MYLKDFELEVSQNESQIAQIENMNLRGRNKVNPNFNMSSMTDIVFLLLIFFMLTSTLVTVNAIDVLLPKASGKTENKTSVSVTVTNKSKFYIDKAEISEKNLELEILNSVGSKNQKTVGIRGERCLTRV